jgi:hypothetical protein
MEIVMQIDWTHFTPWTSLAGGATIGLAAAALLLLSGRTLGVSGIFYGAMTGLGPEFRWRATFLLGLLAASTVPMIFFTPTSPHFDMPIAQVVLGGLLVGLGARLVPAARAVMAFAGSRGCLHARWSPNQQPRRRWLPMPKEVGSSPPGWEAKLPWRLQRWRRPCSTEDGGRRSTR